MDHTEFRHGVGAVLASAMIALAALPGCAPWATYPPIPGAAQIGQVHHEPVPTLIASAIRATHERLGQDEEIVFALPPGSPPRAYEAVRARLADQGLQSRRMRSADESALHVTAVRVRTVDAEVDVVYPVDSGDTAHHRMKTLTLRARAPHGYVVTEMRRWGMRVQPPEYAE